MTTSQPPSRLPLALTMGEPAGIGGEIALKAWQTAHAAGGPVFFALDDPERLAALARQIGWEIPVTTIAAPEAAAGVFARALPVLPVPLPRAVAPGKPDPANAPAVIEAIRRAVELTQAGRAAAVVTNPIHKKVLYDAGFQHPGHTEYLGELTGVARPVMMLATGDFRVVPPSPPRPSSIAAASPPKRSRAISASRSRASPSPDSIPMPAKRARSGARTSRSSPPPWRSCAPSASGPWGPCRPTPCSTAPRAPPTTRRSACITIRR